MDNCDLPASCSEVQGAIRLALTRWEGWPCLRELLDRHAEKAGYVFGGLIRNTFLGHAGYKDVDILLEGDSMDPWAIDMARRGRVECGPFGNVRWFPPTKDGTYCDAQLICRWEAAVGPCRSIREVLSSVDATCNALAYDLRSGDVLDPLNGERDLRRRILRAVRFDRRELDVLEIPFGAIVWFRLYHYAAVYGLEIESNTHDWLRKNARYREYLSAFKHHFFNPRLDLFEAVGL